MSFYAHQMEGGDSSQSLTSRRDSEIGSHYVVEAGLYMTSFAATIFIAALATVGLLLVTLLIALTIMLQSCQSKSTGVLQLQGPSFDYDYCKIFALHAEVNGLKADEFPAVCKFHAVQYIKEGNYLRDLNLTTLMVEDYFSSLTPKDDGLDVVLMDIDDIFTSNSCHTGLLQYQFGRNDGDCWVEEANHLGHMFFLRLHMKLQGSGWSLIFISRKPENQRNAAIEHLVSVGFGNWSSLIMRLDDEMQMENWEYFSNRRKELQNQGFRITSVISSQMDALTGPCLGKRIFKLANPVYLKLASPIENKLVR